MSASSSLSGSFGTLDVNALVTQLMQVERNPAVLLQNRQLQIKNKATAIKGVATDVKNLRTAAEALTDAARWQPLKASSSSTAVTTTASSGALTGSLTFSVTRLASAEKRYTGAIASTAATVTSPGTFLVAAGLGAMGVGTAAAGADLTTGRHTVAFTAAGTATRTSSTTVGAGTNTTIAAEQSLDIKVGGVTYTLNLAEGTYEGPQEVLDMVKASIAATPGAGDVLTASMDGGKLSFATVATGSSATIQITGGTDEALTALGFAVDDTATTGAARVTVDGHVNLIDDADNAAGKTLVLEGKDGATEAVRLTLTGELKTGTAAVHGVDLGSGNLAEVVSAINGAHGSVSASAVQSGGQYRFQVESKHTGAEGALNIDWTRFTGVTFSTLTQAADAEVAVKTDGGDTAYTITSSSNTFSDVLPGLSFTLNGAPTEPVTVTAARDTNALVDTISKLVDAFNVVVYSVKNKSTWNPDTRVAGPLVGNSTARRAVQELTSAFTDVVGAAALKTSSAAGITLGKDGTLTFDKAAFTSAYEADPAGTQRLFFAPLGEEDPGIAQRLMKVADSATSFGSGYLTTSGNQFDSTVASIDKQLTAFEDRMKIRETALRRQWNAINTMLEQLNGQSNSLMQALSSVPNFSFSSSSSS